MHNSSYYPEGNLALVGAVSTAPLTDLQINLLKRIEQNPGIRYRELARLTGLVNGVLSKFKASFEDRVIDNFAEIVEQF